MPECNSRGVAPQRVEMVDQRSSATQDNVDRIPIGVPDQAVTVLIREAGASFQVRSSVPQDRDGILYGPCLESAQTQPAVLAVPEGP